MNKELTMRINLMVYVVTMQWAVSFLRFLRLSIVILKFKIRMKGNAWIFFIIINFYNPCF